MPLQLAHPCTVQVVRNPGQGPQADDAIKGSSDDRCGSHACWMETSTIDVARVLQTLKGEEGDSVCVERHRERERQTDRQTDRQRKKKERQREKRRNKRGRSTSAELKKI